MSKKHKSRYVDSGVKVVAVGETISFDKKEEDHMDKEWFYLNDITWYKSTDGRVVAPVKGVVKQVGRPILNSDYVLASVAKRAIVDAEPFGACYDREKLMAICTRVKLDAFANGCDAGGREPYILTSNDDQTDSVKLPHGGVFEITSKAVEAENESLKDCTDE